MAEGKKSFLMYCDWLELFEELPDDVAGKLIKHVFKYVNDLNPTTDDLVLKSAFSLVKMQLKRDLKKYEDLCERNRLKALKRWDATASNSMQEDAPHADIDNDTDIDNDIDKEKEKAFASVWKIYDYKKNKKKSKVKWLSLSKKDQELAIAHIPSYVKTTYTDNRYPTRKHLVFYLNAETWNDEITVQNDSKFPDEYSKQFENSLKTTEELQEYWRHLRNLGCRPIKTSGRTKEWIKE